MKIMDGLFDTDAIINLLNPEIAIYLFVVVAMFYLGKKLYDLFTPYSLDEQITKVDNKAVAVSFAGYMFALGIVFWGVLSGESGKGFYFDLLDTVVWGIIGILLLQVSRFINDKLLLYQFDNIKELVQDRNIGTGAVEGGTYIGTALLIMAAISGEGTGFIEGIISTLLFFICGQIAFVAFGRLYQKITCFDIHEEIEKDNVSAGIAFGLTLVAMGILLSGFIIKSDSLPGFAVWFLLSSLLLIICRYITDKLILPGSLLDEEISRDRNWGAALVEGLMAVIFAVLINALF